MPLELPMPLPRLPYGQDVRFWRVRPCAVLCDDAVARRQDADTTKPGRPRRRDGSFASPTVEERMKFVIHAYSVAITTHQHCPADGILQD
eukprot:1302060-Pleurochrysis_carterae.AAC.1